MPRNALAAVSQLASVIVPAAEAVQNHDLVPERPLRFHRGDAADRQVGVRQIVGGIRLHASSSTLGSSADFAPPSIFTADRM